MLFGFGLVVFSGVVISARIFNEVVCRVKLLVSMSFLGYFCWLAPVAVLLCCVLLD